MAALALTGRMRSVRLSEIPESIRVEVAEKAIERWHLSGTEAASLMIAAYRGAETVSLAVDEAKAEQVLAGRMVPGPFLKLEDLAVPR
jgi:hypothetical protein